MASAVASSAPFESKESTQVTQLYTRVRLATPLDVDHIHKLVYKMADYHHIANTFEATEASLSSHLFKSPPFKSFTTFLAEASTKPFPELSNSYFKPVERVVRVDQPVVDPEHDTFKCSATTTSDDDHADATVVGYALVMPNFSTLLGKPGFHLEDLFIREGFRAFGIGKMLLSCVAHQTAKLGYGRVEWTVVDWNSRSHQFYQRMGAEVLPEWKICRLSGEILQAYGERDPSFD